MADNIRGFRCNLDGDIVLDSLIPVNTSGAFCDLFTATHPTAGKLALKRPRGDCYDDALVTVSRYSAFRVSQRIEIEAGVWVMLRHPRILQFLGICKIGEDIYLVSPFAENGSLPRFLNVRPQVDRKRVVVEIAEGLAYLHQCGIIHGDLKGNNILISKEEHVLLCDFGLAKHVTSRTSTSLRGVGSIPWQSPELLRDASRRTFQSDLYAFGITIYEVLSGKEPYVDHSGIGSIIAAVLFSAERPPKEPLAAPDGTSYVQLWHEASRCWDEDPALRPSVATVLARLDPERAEGWITAQQIALEASLGTSVGNEAIAHSAHISDGPSTTTEVTDSAETLLWAGSIRSRLATFMNSKHSISRMPPEVLAAIILQDDTHFEFRNEHPFEALGLFLSEGQLLISNISRMFRCAELRQISRAWRRAVDTSTQLCSFVWVGNDHSNVDYIQHYNPHGPLKCVVSEIQSKSSLSILRPIAPRISRIAIVSLNQETAEVLEALAFPMLTQLYYTSMNEEILPQRSFISLNSATNSMMALVLEKVSFQAFEPTVFESLHTIKIAHSMAHDTFTADLFAVLSTSPNLAELVLENLKSGHGLVSSPPSRVTHHGLQRIRLNTIPPPIMSALWLYLDTDNLSTLVAYGLEPSHLPSPELAFTKTIRSLLLGNSSPNNNVEISLGSGVRPDQNSFTMHWPSVTCAIGDKPPVKTSWESWDFNMVAITSLSNAYATTLLRILFSTGINVEGVTLDLIDLPGRPGEARDRSLGLLSPESQSWLEILTGLDSLRKMSIRVSLLDGALKHLSQPLPSVVNGHQYACPQLTHLEVLSRYWFSERWPENPTAFQEHIARRQQAAGSLDGPARLEKIGIPFSWNDQIRRNDRMFDGVEIYYTF